MARTEKTDNEKFNVQPAAYEEAGLFLVNFALCVIMGNISHKQLKTHRYAGVFLFIKNKIKPDNML